MKKNFNHQGRAEKFRAESILAQKISRLRLALITKINNPKATFSLEECNAFIENIRSTLKDDRIFNAELENIVKAVKQVKAPKPLNLSSPELQLLWAASLLYIHRTAKKEITYPNGNIHKIQIDLINSRLWQQVGECLNVKQMLYDGGVYVNEELRRTDTRFAWGVPGSGITYNRKDKTIHVDLMTALAAGLEHTNSLMIREIGRGQLSISFPQKLREIRTEINRLKEKEAEAIKAKESLSDVDYKALRQLALEWEMRQMLWRVAETCTANRYAEIKGREKSQQFSYSLNNVLMTGSVFGVSALDALRGTKKNDSEPLQAELKEIYDMAKSVLEERADQLSEAEQQEIKQQIRQLEKIMGGDSRPEQRFIHILNAIELSFFKNNGLFDNTRKGWEMFDIKPDQIRITKEGFKHKQRAVNDNKDSFPPRDFQLLLDLCTGTEGLENLQPSPKDRWYGKEYFNSLAESHSMKRNRIIEKIWDLYIQDIADDLARELDRQLDEDLDNEKKEGQSQKSKEAQKQDNEGEGQEEQEEQEGQEQESDSGQENSQGSQSSQKPGKGSQGKGKPQNFGAGDKPFGDNSKDSEPGKSRQDFDPSKAGTNKKQVDVKNDKEQTKSMDDVALPPEHPEGREPDQKNDGQGQDAKGQGKEGAEGKTLEQIKKELEEAAKKAAEKQQQEAQGKEHQDGQGSEKKGEGKDKGKGTQGKSSGDGSPSSEAGEGGEGKTLEEIAASDWKSYSSLLSQIRHVIGSVTNSLKKIRDKQLEKTTERSPALEMIPEDKDLSRLNTEAHKSKILKQKDGRVEKDDLNLFHKDKTGQTPTTIDIVLLIDGSGSMTYGDMASLLGKARPMDIALLTSIILYEAAKKVDANVYIALWGNDRPILLAKPGDDRKMIEANLLKARNGLQCGTNLAPSIPYITKTLADQKGSGDSGLTHIIILSDGDISDPEESLDAVQKLLSTNKYVTLDFALLRKKSAPLSDIEKFAEDVRVATPTQKIGIFRGSNMDEIAAGVIDLLAQKMMKLGSFSAVSWARKRKLFQQAHRKFDMK